MTIKFLYYTLFILFQIKINKIAVTCSLDNNLFQYKYSINVFNSVRSDEMNVWKVIQILRILLVHTYIIAK